MTRQFWSGEVVNGAVFQRMPKSQPPQQPIYLVHRLEISDPTRGYGLPERVLLSTFPDEHESSSFDIVGTVEEFRLTDPACWVDLPESVVLGLFHQQTHDLPQSSRRNSTAQVVNIVFVVFAVPSSVMNVSFMIVA